MVRLTVQDSHGLRDNSIIWWGKWKINRPSQIFWVWAISCSLCPSNQRWSFFANPMGKYWKSYKNGFPARLPERQSCSLEKGITVKEGFFPKCFPFVWFPMCIEKTLFSSPDKIWSLSLGRIVSCKDYSREGHE